jgi:heme exporter protein B
MSGMGGFYQAVRAVYLKDIQLELRTRDSMSAMLVFGILVVTIFNFALNLAGQDSLRLAPGVLWVAFLFAGILGLNRSFVIEQENHSLHGVTLAPVDAGAVFLGKVLANVTFMTVFELILLPIFILMFNLNIFDKIPAIMGAVFLGTLGFATVGTTLSAISVNTKMRDVLLPVLLFPLVFPVVIASVEATGLIMRGIDTGLWDWLRLLVGCDVIFMVISILVFEYILVE